MRCEDIRERLDSLWEDGPFSEVDRHVGECAACARYVRNLRIVRAGFQALKREAAPEPSLGFHTRLLRRLSELSKQPTLDEFLEQVGRRFVFATLVLTFLMLMALVLPSTGPVRSQSTADLLLPPQETVLVHSDPLGDIGLQDVSDTTSPEGTGPSAPKGAK